MDSVTGSQKPRTVMPVAQANDTSHADAGSGLGAEIITVRPARPGGADRIDFNKDVKDVRGVSDWGQNSALASLNPNRNVANASATFTFTGSGTGSFSFRAGPSGAMPRGRPDANAIRLPNPNDSHDVGLGNVQPRSTVVISSDAQRQIARPYEIHLQEWLDAINTGEATVDDYFRGFVEERIPTVRASATEAILRNFAILIPIAPVDKRMAMFLGIVRQDRGGEVMKRAWSDIGIDQFAEDDRATVQDSLRALGIVASLHGESTEGANAGVGSIRSQVGGPVNRAASTEYVEVSIDEKFVRAIDGAENRASLPDYGDDILNNYTQ